jgi:hypothetical protein
MYTKQQFRDSYKKLPQQTREVIASLEFSELVENIAQSYKLSKQQSDDLIKLTTHTLIGIEKEEELTQNIQKTISIDQPTASRIALDIKTKIIQSLDKIHDIVEKNIEIADGEGTELDNNSIKLKNWSTDHADKDAAEQVRNSVAKQKSVSDLLNQIK